MKTIISFLSLYIQIELKNKIKLYNSYIIFLPNNFKPPNQIRKKLFHKLKKIKIKVIKKTKTNKLTQNI